MITRLTTGFHAALLFALEEVDELRHRRFFHTESVPCSDDSTANARAGRSNLRFDLN